MNKLEENQNKAAQAFREAASPPEPKPSTAQQKSMTTRFSIEEGPRPPWAGQIVQRQAFQRRWEETGRAARAEQKACTVLDRTLELKEPRLHKNFNRQSGFDNGLGR